MSVRSRKVHLAGGDLEGAVYQTNYPVGEVAWEVRTKVRGAILENAPRDIDARPRLVGQFDVRVGLVVAEQDVIARLVLLDEVVLERQGLFFVIEEDVVDGSGGVDQAGGLAFREPLVAEIAADPVTEILRLSDIEDLAGGVLVEVDAGSCRQL